MKHLFILLTIFSSTIAFSQNLSYRHYVENHLIVVSNRCVLPINGLDTLKIKFISDHQAKPFFQALNRYTLVKQNPKNYNYVIAAIFNYKTFRFDTISRPLIAVVFDTSVTQIEHLLDKAQAVILAFGKDSLFQDYAVQMLFGAIPCNSHLPKTIGFLPKGFGIHTPGGWRLKYTIPQEVGLDSAFIFSKVDSLANLGIKVHAYPGCQILAAVNGKVIFYKAFGYHTYDSIQPVKMTDLYDLASITKIAATAPCLMKLYDQHKIRLNQTLGQLCSCVWFSNKSKIKLIDALTHQARLQPWIPFWKFTVDKNYNLKKRFYSRDSSAHFPYKVAQNIYADRKVKRLIFRKIRRSKLLPKKQYKYSDLSFYLYPRIISRLSKQKFPACLYKYFYHPLGAYRMVYNPYKYFPLNQIIPTEYDSLFRKQQIHGTVHDEGAAMMGGISGHAGLFATANDLAKLMQMYMNYGVYANHRYISDTTLKKWTSYQFPQLGNRRGIVFDKPLLKHPERGTPSPLASPLSFGHTGFTGTFTWDDPKYKLLIVFLSNRVYPTRKNLNLIHYNIRTQIHDVFYKAILKAQNKK